MDRKTNLRRRAATLAALLALGATEARAQEPATLTLEEAIELARRNNPDFRMLANDESEADWRVREAYASLLPRSSASLRLGYQGEGQPLVDPALRDVGVSRVPEYYSSGYSLSLGYELSAATLFRLGEARASRESTVAAIEAMARTLELDVTRQYLAVLRAIDAVELARADLESARENEELALARARVGAGTQLEVKQAEVERGRAEVALLEAEHLVRTERLRLMEVLGVQFDREIELTSEFEVFEPRWDVDQLIAEALGDHPRLRALRAAEAAGNAAKRAAWSTFLPSLSLSVSWSGFTQQVGSDEYLIGRARNRALAEIENCEFINQISAGLSTPLPDRPMDCAAAYTLTPVQEAELIAGNDVFPFEFTRQPLFAQLRISVPIFSGFERRRQIETARVAAEDAREQRRAEELARRTLVAEALLTLETAYRRVTLEERNAAAAAEQLRLARRRYRLGAGDFIELSQAEADHALASRDHLDAVYTFHESLVALEAAVGRPLRGEAGR
ncbi:MAG TPA: TolC family protein [Longimicrobiales bacterium]